MAETTEAVVRLAEPADLQVVQDLNHELFLSDDQHLHDLNVNWPYEEAGERYFRKRIDGDGGVCFVAELGGRVVGYVAGGWSGLPVAAYKGKRAELENICVAADYRSRGVGALLTNALFEWARQNGADYMMVDVYTANEAAERFYKKEGFSDYSTVLWREL